MPVLSHKLLTLLQFTRAALVFTALADTLAALLLRAGSWSKLELLPAGAALLTSACLYAFGMALNDLVDHRKDKLLAASRPIPSGRLGVYTAHVIVTGLAVSALGFGAVYAWLIKSQASFGMLLLTLLLINFYNFAGKYLVSAGLLTLGLVRFCHAMIAAPPDGVMVVWHPLWLFTHVVILSAVAYVWEEKRPRITPVHAAVLYTGLVLVNVVTVAVYLSFRYDPATGSGGVATTLGFGGALLVPVSSTTVFIALGRWIGASVGHGGGAGAGGGDKEADAEGGKLSPLRTRRRQGGQRLMLAGLLWLIVHDAAMVLAFVGWREAIAVLLLLPVAYAAVRLMRGWSKLMQLTKPPQFRRATSL